MTPRCVYLGGFGKHWHTEVHIADDLERLGWHVTRITVPIGARNDFLDGVERACEGADLLLWTRAHDFDVPHRDATALWRRLETNGTKTAGIHLDLYWGLSRAPVIGSAWWSLGTMFTADGDPASAEMFDRMGINHVWSPAAICSTEAEPGRALARWKRGVVFIGQAAASYPVEWPWRGALIEWLRQTYGIRFRLLPGTRGPIRGRALADVCASVTVVVGDTLALLHECETCGGSGLDDVLATRRQPGQTQQAWRAANANVTTCARCRGTGQRRHENYWSDRVYETVGRGGFIVHPRVPGIEQHFENGEHLRLYDYGDFDGLRETIDYYLAHPMEARVIGERGRQHVRAHHTYMHRMAAVLDHLGLPHDEPVPA